MSNMSASSQFSDLFANKAAALLSTESLQKQARLEKLLALYHATEAEMSRLVPDALWLTRSNNYIASPSAAELAQVQTQILEQINRDYQCISGEVQKQKVERDRRFDIQDMVAEMNKKKVRADITEVKQLEEQVAQLQNELGKLRNGLEVDAAKENIMPGTSNLKRKASQSNLYEKAEELVEKLKKLKSKKE